MGNNQAWLKVKATSLGEVEAAVIASYEGRGARIVGRHFDTSLPERWGLPDCSLPTTLGVAIRASSEQGWILISDSLRYTADAQLAEDLAGRLETTVFSYNIADLADLFVVERFGRPLDPPKLIDLDEYRRIHAPDTRFVVFEDVVGYDPDPRVMLDTPCPLCGLRWSPGSIEVPSWPDRLVSLHPGRPRHERPRVLFRWICGTIDVQRDDQCVGEGWATGVIDHELLVELHALSDAALVDGPPDDLDVVLESQIELEEIEQLLDR